MAPPEAVQRPLLKPRASTAPGSPVRRDHGGATARSRRQPAPAPPFPPGSPEAQVWRVLAYRGQIPTVDAVNQEVQRRTGAPTTPTTPTKKPLRRAAVAARLANQGPAVAGYVASHWAAHRTAPTWLDIARALHWPGDVIDHERALNDLARFEWIIGNGTDPTYPGPRWTDRLSQRTATPR